ncbi:MAG: hypothetical protein ACLF0G_08155 [Candidatus Brocadiia bacterium]
MAHASPQVQQYWLDKYIVDEEREGLRTVLVRQLDRAPWWTISFLVHLLALLVMWRWPVQVTTRALETGPVEVGLRPTEAEAPPERDVRPPELPDIEPEPDAPTLKGLAAPPRPAEPMGEPDLELPEPQELSPDVHRPVAAIAEPAMTPVFAVRGPGEGPRRNIYGGNPGDRRPGAVGGPGGTTLKAEQAVNLGLLWLAKAQEPDGRWSGKKWDGGEHAVGVSGLALLAFLGAGYTPHRGLYRATVARGLAWLRSRQKPDGRFAWTTFYEQGIAAMAACEAYALSRIPALRRMAQRAVDYICAVQPPHGGFRYQGAVDRAHGDISVTGWQIMAIKSALAAGLDVPERAVERSRLFLRNVSRPDGRCAYLVGSDRADPATSAIGMLCKQFIGGDFHDEIARCADYLLERASASGEGKNKLAGDLYYTYYATLAIYQMGPGGEYWFQWNRRFREPLVARQVHTERDERGRFVEGSWAPAAHHWGGRGGRVYTTAMALLSLEVYYRLLPVYGAGQAALGPRGPRSEEARAYVCGPVGLAARSGPSAGGPLPPLTCRPQRVY